MDLRYTRRGKWCFIDKGKGIGNGTQFLFNDPFDNIPRNWFGLVQALLEFLHIFCRKESGAAGDELPQFGIGGPHALKERAQYNG